MSDHQENVSRLDSLSETQLGINHLVIRAWCQVLKNVGRVYKRKKKKKNYYDMSNVLCDALFYEYFYQAFARRADATKAPSANELEKDTMFLLPTVLQKFKDELSWEIDGDEMKKVTRIVQDALKFINYVIVVRPLGEFFSVKIGEVFDDDIHEAKTANIPEVEEGENLYISAYIHPGYRCAEALFVKSGVAVATIQGLYEELKGDAHYMGLSDETIGKFDEGFATDFLSGGPRKRKSSKKKNVSDDDDSEDESDEESPEEEEDSEPEDDGEEESDGEEEDEVRVRRKEKKKRKKEEKRRKKEEKRRKKEEKRKRKEEKRRKKEEKRKQEEEEERIRDFERKKLEWEETMKEKLKELEEEYAQKQSDIADAEKSRKEEHETKMEELEDAKRDLEKAKTKVEEAEAKRTSEYELEKTIKEEKKKLRRKKRKKQRKKRKKLEKKALEKSEKLTQQLESFKAELLGLRLQKDVDAMIKKEWGKSLSTQQKEVRMLKSLTKKQKKTIESLQE